jgi:hypothetical protein
MEQIEMKQMLEHLMIEMKAQIGGLASKMDANERKMDSNQAESMANQLKMEASQERTNANLE